MDFDWSEEQLAYKKAVIAFARQRLNQGMVERDRQGVFSRELWDECAKFGIQGLPFPEEYGGGSADILTTMLTMEGLGYGCPDNGLIFGINAATECAGEPADRVAAQRRGCSSAGFPA